MATILEIAQRADVPVEAVLRVVNGSPVSEAYALRVKAAMTELGGSPEGSMVEALREVAHDRTQVGDDGRVQANSVSTELDLAASTMTGQLQGDLLESREPAASTLETSIPGLQRVVYEALRVEVHPVAEHVGAVGAVVSDLKRSLDTLRADAGRERSDRLRDIEVLIDLIVTGWQTVDRRLGRIEKMLDRMPRDSLSGRPSTF